VSNSEDQPTVIIEKDSGSELGAFLLGAIVGAGLALLFAPQTGQETQDQLRARAKKLREATEERVSQIREDVSHQLDSVKGVVEQGRQVAVDARGELEDRLERSKAAYRAGVETTAPVADDPAPVPEGGGGSGADS